MGSSATNNADEATAAGERVAQRLGMDAAGILRQKAGAALFAELKAAGALSGLDQQTLDKELNSSNGAREEMGTLYRTRRVPLNFG
jgi:hypothetical protein